MLPFYSLKVYLVSQGKGDKTESRIKTATTAFRQRTWDNSLSSQGLMAKTSSSEMERPLNQRDIEVTALSDRWGPSHLTS